ncbi:MAG: hypothetical protein Kow0037_07500 [Calditrichia bacterium]
MMENFQFWKRAFFISLSFNLAVILTFVIYTFVVPGSQKPETSSAFQLTPSQAKKIGQIKLEMDRELKPHRQALIEKRLRVWELTFNPGIDSLSIQQEFDSLIQNEMALKRIRYRYWIKENLLLTPEQRKKKFEQAYRKLKEHYRENYSSQ